MRLLALNLQNRTTTRSVETLAYLRQVSPSLMVFSDVKWTKRIENFCGDLNDYCIEVSNRDGEAAVMIASKWPLEVVQAQRCFLEVLVPEANIHIIGAYLPSPNSKRPDRKAERNEFWELLRDRSTALRDAPAVIAGDLNSFLPEDSHNRTAIDDHRIRDLRKGGWQDAWVEFRDQDDTDCYTWDSRHGKCGGFRLDYVFLSPGLIHRTQGTRARHDLSTRAMQVSDHAAVVVDFPS